MDIVAIIEAAGLEPRSYFPPWDVRQEMPCVGVAFSNLAFDLAELVEACANVEEAAAVLRAMKIEAAEAEMMIYWPKVAWQEAA